MKLQQQLDKLTAEFANKIPDAAKATMKQANQTLIDSGILERTIKVGDQLPNFTLKNQNGDNISSTELLKQGPLVISFFRGVWCPYCNLEIQALEQYATQFLAEGANIVVISPQAQASNQRTVEQNKLSFDVLMDAGNNYADKLNISFTLAKEIKALYSGFGINLAEHNGEDSWTLPMPTRLVVSTDGNVIAADINPDYTQRPDPSETLTTIKSIKNTH